MDPHVVDAQDRGRAPFGQAGLRDGAPIHHVDGPRGDHLEAFVSLHDDGRILIDPQPEVFRVLRDGAVATAYARVAGAPDRVVYLA